MNAVVEIIFNAFSEGNKILLCGNGGSASDAQHIAAELTGRFFKDRTALFAEALHVNSSYMTAVANDYGFEKTYSRLLEAKGNKGDVLIVSKVFALGLKLIALGLLHPKTAGTHDPLSKQAVES